MIDDWPISTKSHKLIKKFSSLDDQLSNTLKELGSFIGKKDPDRCTRVVTQLRYLQSRILQIIADIYESSCNIFLSNEPELFLRLFRTKYPNDLNLIPISRQNLLNSELTYDDNVNIFNLYNTNTGTFSSSLVYPGFIWFAAECLASGSLPRNMQRGTDYESLTVLAKEFVLSIETLRKTLKSQSHLPRSLCSEFKIQKILMEFDRIFADFEYRYVSFMAPIKTAKEAFYHQLLIVHNLETLTNGVEKGYFAISQIEEVDPGLMITLPRLALFQALRLLPNDGPLYTLCSADSEDTESDFKMFAPYKKILLRIHSFVETLSPSNVLELERMLCDCKLDPNNQRNNNNNVQLFLASDNLFDNNCNKEDTIIYINESEANSIVCLSTKSDVKNKLVTKLRTNCKYINRLRCNRYITTMQLTTDDTPVIDKKHSDANVKCGNIQHKRKCLPLVLYRRLVCYNAYNVRYQMFKRRKKLNTVAPFNHQLPFFPSHHSHVKRCKKQMKYKKRLTNNMTVMYDPHEDLIHRLFICISGVSDMMQTYYAADFRDILHQTIKLYNADATFKIQNEVINGARNHNINGNVMPCMSNSTPEPTLNEASPSINTNFIPYNTANIDLTNPEPRDNLMVESPPLWVPDSESQSCNLCDFPFTLFRRRHHCRSCGQIFCSKCCYKFVSLPIFGITKAVRVCERCNH